MMKKKHGIEWTGKTWNPSTGCSKVSPGCKSCYAEKMAMRAKAMGLAKYANGFELTLHEHTLEDPLLWRKPQVVFVNSMSDLFHKDIPLEFLLKVFNVMCRAHWHQFQILTKRSERLLELAHLLPWPKNVWMGVSVENQDYVHRIDHLRQTPAAVKFLSLEPLLGPLPNLYLEGIDWIICGGESGAGAREMSPDWVRDLRDQSIAANIPFFMKQWGGVQKWKTGRELDGVVWDQMPGFLTMNEIMEESRGSIARVPSRRKKSS